MQKKRSVTPIGHSQYLTGKVATCSGLPHLPVVLVLESRSRMSYGSYDYTERKVSL